MKFSSWKNILILIHYFREFDCWNCFLSICLLKVYLLNKIMIKIMSDAYWRYSIYLLDMHPLILWILWILLFLLFTFINLISCFTYFTLLTVLRLSEGSYGPKEGINVNGKYAHLLSIAPSKGRAEVDQLEMRRDKVLIGMQDGARRW